MTTKCLDLPASPPLYGVMNSRISFNPEMTLPFPDYITGQNLGELSVACFVPPAESAGPDRHTSGGRQSYTARQHRAREYCGGANLPATVENSQRLRPAERPGPARLPTTGRITVNISY